MISKVCSKCKQEKKLDHFNKNKSNFNGLQNYCRECKRKGDEEYIEKNKILIYKKHNEKQKQIRIFISEIKNKLECLKCKENRYYCLDFHHIDPNQKDANVGSIIGRKGGTKDKILEEIKKCVPLCSNCHREFHHLEKFDKITIEEYLGKEIIENYKNTSVV